MNSVSIRSGLSRAIVFALLWWILTEGAINTWLVGAPVVLLTMLVSIRLLPPFTCSLTGIMRFIPFFLWHSLRGGVDVAWRAFQPVVPVVPDVIDYPLRLPPGLPRVFLVNTVSLLPGTLSTGLGENCLRVHVLDSRKDVLPVLTAVEQGVARVFGISL